MRDEAVDLGDDRLGVAAGAGGVVDVTDLVSDGVLPRDRMTALITSWPTVAGAVSDAATAMSSTARRSSCGRRFGPRRSSPLR